ncbi:unnamed protein product [Cuscuta campestris]|uniref:Uncharacterized protein n=1 Tax=Cuscuta campestris TaxID=132261 RepID=A0A484L5J7_9ASTE|nr:unnamed protein product [Cuscuta campestris]
MKPVRSRRLLDGPAEEEWGVTLDLRLSSFPERYIRLLSALPARRRLPPDATPPGAQPGRRPSSDFPLPCRAAALAAPESFSGKPFSSNSNFNFF